MRVNPQFDAAEDFSEGSAAVRIGDDQNGKWGFIDKEGKFAVNPRFRGESGLLAIFCFCDFHDGLASVREPGRTGG
jgi:hypothetical protein